MLKKKVPCNRRSEQQPAKEQKGSDVAKEQQINRAGYAAVGVAVDAAEPHIQKPEYRDSLDLTMIANAMAHDPTLGPLGTFSSSSIDELELIRETVTLNSTGKNRSKSTKKSASDLVLETYTRSLSGRMSEFGSLESFMFPSAEMAAIGPSLSAKSGHDETISCAHDPNEWFNVLEIVDHPTFEEPVRKTEMRKTYSLSKKKLDFYKLPLPNSAATFYESSLHELEVVEACESIDRLTRYLNERKADLKAGVPGRFLHAVIGQEVSDLGSIASTIMYAFYLHETLNSSQLCTLPIINMKREDLNMHAEVKWLFDACQIDPSSLVFIDEMFKEALVEIFNCKQANTLYPWVNTVTMGQDCSCCTLVAEKFTLSSPEILAGKAFSRLLLAGILLDTGNLNSVDCTSKDKYMATLLINGAGRFGCNGLYQILKYKKFDVSGLKVREILRKDFKKWARLAGKPDSTASRLTVSNVGMSSIGISIGQLLAREACGAEEVILFQKSEKLRLLMVVSGYYDNQKIFKREILVSAETAEHMRNLLHFFNSNASQLPLKVLSQPGLREELRAFEIDNKIMSRKTIERLLEDFGGTARRA
ncbi:uncharacterized protein LOC131221767 [Magnolia sinica]|uniref:uncharacterized protein LOC131221767 n=1 Tax=Magnolia sinica TaxID=86752 RepID=UPI00265AA21D|nr:uncharacterized protein LOC131221767 [Magnolia sinica]